MPQMRWGYGKDGFGFNGGLELPIYELKIENRSIFSW